MSQIAGKFLKDNAVTNAKLAQAATLTIKGNNTGGTANVLDLTATQVTAMLNVFTSGLQGLVPASGGGTSNFLRADGTWTTTGGLTNPMTTLGDTIYGGIAGAATRLAGDTSNTRKFLLELSVVGVATAPIWDTIQAGDVPTLNQNTTGTASNVTGVVALVNGGTGTAAASANAAFNALSPLTTKGDIVSFSSVNARVPIGTDGQVLTADSAMALGLKWATPTTGTVTSVAMSVPSFLSISGSPVTSSGTLAVTLSGTALPIANGGTGQTTASAAFNALSPITTTGDIIYSSSGTTNSRLAIGSTGQVLTVAGGIPSWATAGTAYVATENAQTGTTYTFALADGSNAGAHPYVTVSNSSAVAITVPPNSSVAFPVGTEIPVINQGSGGAYFSPGSGVTINSFNSRVVMAGQYAQATLLKRATDTWYLYGDVVDGLIVATGGTITTDGDYKVHTFTSSGTFTITSGVGTVQYLVVAGGGGGGGADYGGGGGAGGLLAGSVVLGTAAQTVTVGAGGAAGSNGSNSVFGSFTATGGGTGGGQSINGGNGGSGGGGGGNGGSTAGTGTAGQGNAGGAGFGSPSSGGGGGGAGAGGTAATSSVAGSGGNGSSSSISGSSVTYAGGGGGGTGGGTPGTGGTGGGGAGALGGSNATAGTANTGGGGGSSGTVAQSKAGGSGIVIARYKFQ